MPASRPTAWWGVFAPAKMPDASDRGACRRDRAHRRERRLPQQARAARRHCRRRLSGSAFAEFQRAELAKWGKAVRMPARRSMTSMKLNDEEQDILAGKSGPVPQQALQHQIKVGDFFGADGFRAGHAGPHHGRHRKPRRSRRALAGRARRDCRRAARACASRPSPIRAAPISPRPHLLGQTAAMLDLERRAIAAFVKLGVTMTDTCINYQTIQAPTRNEHVAFGDTGVVIYSNSVCGARSNFEGGPSALAAGLTGRTPRYGFHLPQAAPRHAAHSCRFYARYAQRMGRARRRDRAPRRKLLGGAGDRRHRGRAEIGSAQAFRRGDGELRLDRAVSPRGADAGSEPG